MIQEYLQAALNRAHYEMEDGQFFATVPQLEGVLAYGDTLEACRTQLVEVIEGWIILGLRLGHEIPVLD